MINSHVFIFNFKNEKMRELIIDGLYHVYNNNIKKKILILILE